MEKRKLRRKQMLTDSVDSFKEGDLKQEIARRTSPFFIVEDVFFNNSNFVTNSPFREFMISLVHFIVVALPAVPLITVSIVYWNSRIKWTDPDVPDKYNIPAPSLALLIICLVYLIIALIKLFIYYINYDVNRFHIIPRKVFRIIYFAALIIISFGSLAYVLLIIMWIILGSFVNTDQVLPYLIAVGALFLHAIIFASGKAKIVRAINKQLDEELNGFLRDLGVAGYIPLILAPEEKKPGEGDEKEATSSNLRKSSRKSKAEAKKSEDGSEKDEGDEDEDDGDDDDDDGVFAQMITAATSEGSKATKEEMKIETQKYKIIKGVLNKHVMAILNEMGLSAKRIVGAVLVAVTTLGIFFVFLFIGFESFAGTGTGGTAVKSGLTAVVGLVMSKGSGESDDEQTLQIRSNQLVKQIMRKLKLKKAEIKHEIDISLADYQKSRQVGTKK